MCVNLKYTPLTRLRHPLSYFLIFCPESCTSLRPRAQEGLEMLTAWGRIYAHFSVSSGQRLPPTPATWNPSGSGINRPAGAERAGSGSPRMPRSSRCTAVLSLTRPFVCCGNNAVLAPASRILHPKSRHLSPQLAAPLRAPFLPIPRVPFPSTLRPCPTLTMRSRCSLCL